MVAYDDKYEDDGENLTQVRSIIKHLNEDKPSQERGREVVVRADGTKVVRIRKKRKVMLTSADKRRKGRRQALLFLGAILACFLVAAGFLAFRMATMSSSSYMEQKRSELQQLWGASGVQFEGAALDGTSLCLNNVVVEFPEGSMLQRVELSGVQASLEIMSFVSGRLTSSALSVERALLIMRNGRNMEMPLQQGRDLWRFSRVDCKDFSIVYVDADQAPVNLKNSNAYMYYPSRDRSASVVMLRGGSLDIKGWKTLRIAEGKAHVSVRGVEDFSLSGTTDAVSDETEQRRTSLSMAGRIAQGAAMVGPFAVEAENMSLADFTDGRVEGFLTARTTGVSHGKLDGKFTVSFAEAGAPLFSGDLHLKNIYLSSFPALMAITEHIEHGKRRLYNPIMLNRGYVRLAHKDSALVVEVPAGALAERDVATLRGRIVLSSTNDLSGELHYGIPKVLARVEYPDGQPDPIFHQQGEWAVLSTNLRGRGNMPGDDMAEVEARAAIARRDRPARIPFDQIDVNRMVEQLPQSMAPAQNTQPVQHAQPEVIDQPIQQTAPLYSPLESTPNPFETSEDPFAPSTPF
ncbi:MAG: hypothetical protein IKW48_02765 [Akkermansia sp.]|nr:hypothetical protein [Akkermansia sp.]